MKLGQLLEHNLRNVFLEESRTKCGEETIPRPFFEKSKLSISLDQYAKGLYILFLLFAKLRTIEIDWNWAAEHLHLPQSLFKMQKEVWN